MGSITDIKSALTEKALQFFCETYHIPDEVHPQLPNLDQTIHEMPTGKIGVYTRFFEYANFRLPLSTFFVDVLRYYRIYISQLSVIGATKVSHIEVLCRAHGFEPTVGLFRCLYVNSKNKGWISFNTTVGRIVPLLSVTPARVKSELVASVDRLFDESGSGTQSEQGDSAGGGRDEQDIVIQPVVTVITTAIEDVITLQPRRGKSKSVVQQLLVGAVQNVVVKGEPIPTLPFVTSSVSATPEREEEDHTDSLAGATSICWSRKGKKEDECVVEEGINLLLKIGMKREKGELDIKVADLAATVKVREQEVADLDAMVHKLQASSTVLQDKVTAYDNFMGQLEKFQDDRIREMNEKFNKLDTNLELVIAKCLNSTEYLSSLGAAIGKAVEKGMQEGLYAGITHGATGRVLTDVAAYNPSAEADYLSLVTAFQKSFNFSLSQS
ncbi:hypothetical protein Tco_0970893 [Tanacetum coccineum]